LRGSQNKQATWYVKSYSDAEIRNLAKTLKARLVEAKKRGLMIEFDSLKYDARSDFRTLAAGKVLNSIAKRIDDGRSGVRIHD
jgi:hypothetical protein